MRKIMMLGAAIVFAACSRNPDTSTETAPERTEGQIDTMPGQHAQTDSVHVPAAGDSAMMNIPDTTGAAGAVPQPTDTTMPTDSVNVPPGDSALIEREVPDTTGGVEGALDRWADSTKAAADSTR